MNKQEIKLTAKRIQQKKGHLYYYGTTVRNKLMHIDQKEILLTVENGEVEGIENIEKVKMKEDFTINALYQDVLTNKIKDEYGGRKDLHRHILRAVHSDIFVQHPILVFEMASFASIYNFKVDKKTLEYASKCDTSNLHKEDVWDYFKLSMLNSKYPSVFFEVLMDCHQMDWFEEVEKCALVEQEPSFHPEGNVYNHTMMVLNVAARIKDQSHQPFPFVVSALCHDFGKLVATERINGVIHAYGHETMGIPIIDTFLRRFIDDEAFIEYVINMSKLHMKPTSMVVQRSKQKSMNHLFDDSVEPNDLILLCKADCLGISETKNYDLEENILRDHLSKYYELMRKPYVTKEDIRNTGIDDEEVVDEMYAYSHKLRLAGIVRENCLKQTLSYEKAARENVAKKKLL